MDQQQLKEALGKPSLLRLKALNSSLRVGKVLGSRVLVKTVVPKTEMDRVEEQGLIAIPKHVKEQNTPMPTTGVVLLLGPNLPCERCGRVRYDHHDEKGYRCFDGSPFKSVLEEGDMIMFPKFSGSDFKIENEDFRIVEAVEIICTLVDVEGTLEQTNA